MAKPVPDARKFKSGQTDFQKLYSGLCEELRIATAEDLNRSTQH